MSTSTQTQRPRRRFAGPLLGAIVAALLGLGLSAAIAAAAPVAELNGQHGPTNFQAGQPGFYGFTVQNVGDEVIDGPVELEVELPPGMTTKVYFEPNTPTAIWYYFGAFPNWDCGEASYTNGLATVTCTLPRLVPGQTLPLRVYGEVPAGASGKLSAEATLSAPGMPEVSAIETATIGPEVSVFGTVPGSFEADAFDAEGLPQRQAGSHPFRGYTSFEMNLRRGGTEGNNKPETTLPVETIQHLNVTLPRGFAGNPRVLEQCKAVDLVIPVGPGAVGSTCPTGSQVGTIDLAIQSLLGPDWSPEALPHVPIYNMVPPRGALADFAFSVGGRVTHLLIHLDPRDYSLVVSLRNINEALPVQYARTTFWGVPADRHHDPDRFEWTGGLDGRWGAPSPAPRKAFLSLPTQCGVEETTELSGVESWQGSVDPHVYNTPPVETIGCGQLEFNPSMTVRPTTNVADAPTGLEVDLHLPQNDDPDGLTAAHLRDTVVKLPAGMTVNPPSADGLGACSLAQIGFSASGVPNEAPVACPDASKLGTVETETPAIDHPLKGEIFLAEQNANPFGSLLAMYLAIEDPQTGVRVKLAGKVDPDPVTGQLTATFRNNPQLPVEELHLVFKQGPRAALKTPDACGVHTTEATLTPWSSPEGLDVSSPSSFELVQGPSGGACLPSGAGAANSPSFTAGTVDPTAKAFTPFVLKVARADGTQQFKFHDVDLPKGLLAKLAGIPYCPDSALAAAASNSGKAERASSSCPLASRIASVTVGAGAGSTPLYVPGSAYLAGPYKGAPISMAIVTPAVAGPFDLGTVVVRAALHVDPETGQVREVSDEIPQILQGVPLNIRSVTLKADRPDFILNPTNCDPMKIEASMRSVFGNAAGLSSSFQVADCGLLAFKPELALKLKGGTKRSQFPALTATLTARPGDANIGKTVVALPRSEFLAQSHIRTICTRVQYAAEQCPAGSIYGKATAWSPLLDQPLSGPVYLRSSSNPLPDMVVALDGQIDIDLVGRIDSFKKGIRTTFDTVPDAPVSKFVLEMQGGKKGLLENSRNLCKTVNKATVEMDGQNNAIYDSTPVLQAKCKKQKKAKKKHAKKRGAKSGKKG